MFPELPTVISRAFDTPTGKVRWQKNVRKEFGGIPGTWAYAESPLVDGDLVVVTPGGAEADFVAGAQQSHWRCRVESRRSRRRSGLAMRRRSCSATPAGKQYVQFTGKGIVGVDARTGEFLWRDHEPSKGPGEQSNADSFRFVARLPAPPEGSGARCPELPSALPRPSRPSRCNLTRELPNTNGGAVLLGETLYGTIAGGLVAADYKTGTIRWKADGIGPGSIAAADGHLDIHGENGDVASVAAASDAYQEKGRFTPPNQPKHTTAMEKAWAYPVVANGRLLQIRDRGTLWSVRASGSQRPVDKVMGRDVIWERLPGSSRRSRPPAGNLAARAEALTASRNRILDSLRANLTVQLDPGLSNERRGFYLTYINSFNEWHEGTAFEPAANLADLTPAQRAIGYHNPDEGRWRLELLGDLLRQLTTHSA